MSIEADRESVLLLKVARLTSDVEAQRKALERVTADRDYWRDLAGRFEKLREECRNAQWLT